MDANVNVTWDHHTQVLSAGLTREWNPNVPLNVSTYSAFASCTGLSIFLVNACRSVGIPARMTGIAQWLHAYPPAAAAAAPSPSGALGQPKKTGSARGSPSCPASCMKPDLNTKYQSRRLSTPDPEFANHNCEMMSFNGPIIYYEHHLPSSHQGVQLKRAPLSSCFIVPPLPGAGVSVWDNGIWSFTGASEPNILNHTWFFPDPVKCVSTIEYSVVEVPPAAR